MKIVVPPVLVLRGGLALVFIWFGSQQLADVGAWVTYAPDWLVGLGIQPETIITANGIFELVASFMLLTGLALRPIAWLLTIHTLVIAAEAGGAIGVRDFGLAVATLTLALSIPDHWSLDAGLRERRGQS